MTWNLRDLADPERFTEPLHLGELPDDLLISQLRDMVTIRVVEELIGDQMARGVVSCPCHLAIGQEAVPVGVASRLCATDRVFGTHRSHGHFLAQGGSIPELLAEILGRETGCSGGMGGSMHLQDKARGFYGSVPIVGATVPMAVGAGLAAKMDRSGDVAVAYFGDGAMEEGVVHESMNFAAQFKVPVLFVVENNFFSSHLHIRERQPADSVARFAAAHQMAHHVVDGNDVVAVSAAAGELVDLARDGAGPGFLEAVTYRWRGHVGPSEDQDVGVMRKHDLAQWKKRDPIGRLEASLVARRAMNRDDLDAMRERIADDCATHWLRALAAPFPDDAVLLSHVYKQD